MPQTINTTTDPVVEDNEFYTERRASDGRTYTIAKPPQALPAERLGSYVKEKLGVTPQKEERWKEKAGDWLGAAARVGLPALFGGAPGALMGLADVALQPKAAEAGASTMANVASTALGTKGKAISRILLPALAGGATKGVETGDLDAALTTGGAQAAGGTLGEALPFLSAVPKWISRGSSAVKREIDDLLRGAAQGSEAPGKDDLYAILNRAGEAIPQSPQAPSVPAVPKNLGLGPLPKDPGPPPPTPQVLGRFVSKEKWDAWHEAVAQHEAKVSKYKEEKAFYDEAHRKAGVPEPLGAAPKEPVAPKMTAAPVKEAMPPPPKELGQAPLQPPLNATRERNEKYLYEQREFQAKKAKYETDVAAHEAEVTRRETNYRTRLNAWKEKNAYQEKTHNAALERYREERRNWEKTRGDLDDLLQSRAARKEAPLIQEKIYSAEIKTWMQERGISDDEMAGLVKAFNKKDTLAGMPAALFKEPAVLAGTLKASTPQDQSKIIASYLKDVFDDTKSWVEDTSKKAGSRLLNVRGVVERLDTDEAVIAAMPQNWQGAIRDFREALTKSPNPAALMSSNPATWIIHHAAFRLATTLLGAMGGATTGSLAGGAAGAALAGATSQLAPLLNRDIRRMAMKGYPSAVGAVSGALGRAAGEKVQKTQDLPAWVRQQYFEQGQP